MAKAVRREGLAVREPRISLFTSFRLGKILQSLPLTRVLLGDRPIVREVQRFWRQRPPRSFYAAEEVLAFCDHLHWRLGPLPGLGDVVALERSLIELQRPPGRRTARAWTVRIDLLQDEMVQRRRSWPAAERAAG